MTYRNKYYAHGFNVKDVDMSVDRNEHRIESDYELTMLLKSDFYSIKAIKMYNDRAKRWDATVHIYFEHDMFYTFDTCAYNRVKSFINSLEIGEEDNDN